MTPSDERGGQGTAIDSPVARSKMRAVAARSLAGMRSVIDTWAPGAKRGVSRSGRRGPAGGSSAASRGKSKRTLSTSSRPSQSSKAKRPMRRGVGCGRDKHIGSGSPTRIVPRSYTTGYDHCARSESGCGSGRWPCGAGTDVDESVLAAPPGTDEAPAAAAEPAAPPAADSTAPDPAEAGAGDEGPDDGRAGAGEGSRAGKTSAGYSASAGGAAAPQPSNAAASERRAPARASLEAQRISGLRVSAPHVAGAERALDVGWFR